MLTLRTELPGDRAAVRRVLERAFGQAEEADLVERLRRAADPYLALVAERHALLPSGLSRSGAGGSGVIPRRAYTPWA